MTTINEFQDDYRFLSNFYIGNPIKVQGMTFPTSEHFYQALKTFEPAEIKEILSCRSPGEAKRLGRTLTLREDWDSVKDRAMELCVSHKFAANPELLTKLLETGTTFLVEGNSWHDNYWGVCSCERCEGIPPNRKLNKLGFTLMRYRDTMNSWLKMDI